MNRHLGPEETFVGRQGRAWLNSRSLAQGRARSRHRIEVGAVLGINIDESDDIAMVTSGLRKLGKHRGELLAADRSNRYWLIE